jgi:hypothetical protein
MRETVFHRAKTRYLQNREVDAGAPWREWLWERYARYWYGVGCLFLDVIVAGTVLQGGVTPTQWWQYGAAVLLVIGLAFLEFKGYRRLWKSEPIEV